MNTSLTTQNFTSERNASVANNRSDLINCAGYSVVMYTDCPLLTKEELQHVHNMCNLLPYLHTILIALSIVLGLPGSILTLITVSSMPQNPTLLYLSLLAVADFVSLVIATPLQLLYLDTEDYFKNPNLFHVRWSAEVFQTFSHWNLMLICLERFVSVYFPFHKNRMYRIRNTWISASIAFVVCLIPYVINCLWYLHPSKNGGYDYDAIPIIVHNLVYIVIPGLCIMTFTTSVLFKIRKSRKQRQEMSGRAQNSTMERELTRMMICTAVFFVVLTFPRSGAFVFDRTIYEIIEMCPMTETVYRLLGHSAISMCFLNHAINFYVYIMAPGFRKAFIRVLCGRRTLEDRHLAIGVAHVSSGSMGAATLSSEVPTGVAT